MNSNLTLFLNFSTFCVQFFGVTTVGKTTFIHNLRKVEAETELKNAITLYINLGSEATLAVNLSNYILSQIQEQLREDYAIDVDDNKFVRVVYQEELKRFEKTIY